MESRSTKTAHHIDQPHSWDLTSRCVIVRGWCFLTRGELIRGIRLRAGEISLAGVVGMPRPDVKTAMPSAPGNDTGFELRGVLPTGHVNMSIEVMLPDGTWQLLLGERVKVPRNWLPLWLGGGGWAELMFFQMPGHMKHPARLLRPEKFPPTTTDAELRPRLSIVTPSFQQARYLPETLRCVLEQSNIVCEYVVQDGNSSDGSADIIRNYANGMTSDSGSTNTTKSSVRITTWESVHDEGQADAISRGFAKTSGSSQDIMAWINSDDFYLPGALAFVSDYFARHPEVDVVYGHRVLVDENSREIGRWFLPEHDDEVLQLNDFVPQETLFWRRRIWNKVGGLDKSFKFAMDWDLLLRFQAAGAKIVRLPYFLACFRIHPVQKTSAVMHSTGQNEITLLRERTFGRSFPPEELEKKPVLLRYLRKSAWIEFLWKWGIRAS